MSHISDLVRLVEWNHLRSRHLYLLFSKKTINWVPNVISFHHSSLRMQRNNTQSSSSKKFDQIDGLSCRIYWILNSFLFLIFINFFQKSYSFSGIKTWLYVILSPCPYSICYSQNIIRSKRGVISSINNFIRMGLESYRMLEAILIFPDLFLTNYKGISVFLW